MNQIINSYLLNNINEEQLIYKINELDKKSNKSGVIYTPFFVAEKMIELADVKITDKILEPSCGHGIFLITLLNYMKFKFKLNGLELLNWFEKQVTGIDINEKTIQELKLIIKSYFKKNFSIEINKDIKNIFCQNSLKLYFDNQFDICIGNPPYIIAKNMEKEDLVYLKKNFKSCKKGTVDIYFAFIEKYIQNSSKLIFIIPNTFLVTKSGEVIKKIIENKIELLIDFKDKKIFKDADIYTAIIKLNKDKDSEDIILYGNDLVNINKVKTSSIFKDKLETIKNKNILSGIATLCDKYYTVEKIKDNFFAIYNNKKYEIEKEIVVPYLKLTKIRNQEDLNNIKYMIYPYNEKIIINEETIKNKYPNTYNYLKEIKFILDQRDKGKIEKYETWYAYGRKQGLHNIESKEIVIIPKLMNSECCPIKINIELLLNQYKNIVFTSGLVYEYDKNKQIGNKILEKEFLIFAKENGKIWPAKNNYYYLSTNQIKFYLK